WNDLRHHVHRQLLAQLVGDQHQLRSQNAPTIPTACHHPGRQLHISWSSTGEEVRDSATERVVCRGLSSEPEQAALPRAFCSAPVSKLLVRGTFRRLARTLSG